MIDYNANLFPSVNWSAELAPSPPGEPVDFYGQEDLQNRISPFLSDPVFPHTLVRGEPGLGKTQLGRWLAWKRQEPLQEVMAPISPDQMADSGIVLLDEAHRQRKPEPLFPIMEKADITIIGTTTRPDKLEPAFRSRFVLSFQIPRYTVEGMKLIMQGFYGDSPIDDDDLAVLAGAAGGNPRQGSRIIATAQGLGTTNPDEVLSVARITANGCTEDHLRYLMALGRTPRPLGVGQLAAILFTSSDGVQEIERYLLDLGYVSLTPGGRELTLAGRRFIRMVIREDT